MSHQGLRGGALGDDWVMGVGYSSVEQAWWIYSSMWCQRQSLARGGGSLRVSPGRFSLSFLPELFLLPVCHTMNCVCSTMLPCHEASYLGTETSADQNKPFLFRGGCRYQVLRLNNKKVTKTPCPPYPISMVSVMLSHDLKILNGKLQIQFTFSYFLL